MNEQQLREIVREAVARHLGVRSSAPPASAPVPDPSAAPFSAHAGDHPSHGLYITVVNAGTGCQIEPAVSCNHCGYCKSHGY